MILRTVFCYYQSVTDSSPTNKKVVQQRVFFLKSKFFFKNTILACLKWSQKVTYFEIHFGVLRIVCSACDHSESQRNRQSNPKMSSLLHQNVESLIKFGMCRWKICESYIGTSNIVGTCPGIRVIV